MSIKRSRELRKRMPPAEARLWNYLRSLKEQGYHFRRQVQLGPYYVDFACHHPKLVIEVDGETHYNPEAIAYDNRRSELIRDQGYRVARYSNLEVRDNLEGVATHLAAVLAALPPPLIPPHKGEGDDGTAASAAIGF
ncbi:MAG: endonuclease domain-containing protein [Devosia sp.]|nr:endonuclease domain-containing protein [Devosia sp.]